MKFLVSKKEMREAYGTIISIGYCNAQHLLAHEEPKAYSAGGNGWSCDYYEIDGVLISTGYAPLSNKNSHATYDMIHDYDKRADDCTQNLNAKNRSIWTKDALHALLREFVAAATK